MSVDSRIIARLDQLIELGTGLVASTQTVEMYMSGSTYKVDDEPYYRWRASSLSLLERVFGPESAHYTSFETTSKNTYAVPAAQQGTGVLKAAKDDFENGYLFNTRALIEAEVFDDLLEQAEHLHASGYHAPAAVIAGCVLEDGLRKACGRADVALPASPKLDWMNAELAKQGVYSKLVQKQVTALAGIRNEAAHGNWAAFTKDDVTGMISQVRTIMATCLS